MNTNYNFITISVSLLPLTYIPLEFTNSKYVSFSYCILVMLIIIMFKYVNFKERLHIVEKLFVCLGVYIFLRYAYGLLVEHHTFQESFDMFTGEASRVLSALILFRIGRTPKYRSSIINGIFIALGIVIAFQLFQTIMGLDYLISTGYDNPMFSYYTGHGTMRPFSTFLNPVVYGDFLIILLTFIFWLKPSSKRMVWIKWIALLVGFICLILTKTRSAWVAAIVSVVLVLAFIPNKNWKKIFASFSVIAVLIFSSFFLVPSLSLPYLRRFLTIFNPSYNSNSIRLSLWEGTIRAITNNPIFGYGQGDFETVLSNYLPHELAILGHPNQTVLEFCFRYGIIGLAICFLIVIAATKTMFINVRNRNFDVIPPLAGCVSFVICSFFESLWGSYSMMITVFLILGVGLSSEQKLNERSSYNEPNKKTLPT